MADPTQIRNRRVSAGRRFFSGVLLLAVSLAASGVRARSRTAPPAWKAVARLPFPNHDVAYALLDDHPCVAGGMAFVGPGEEHRYYADLLTYDRRQDRWEALPPLHTPRALAGMAELDGKLWAVGGRTGDAPDSATATAELYEPRRREWRDLPPLRSPRTEPGVAALRGRVYAIGGANQRGFALATVESCDPVTLAWRAEVPLPAPRRGLVALTAENRIWVAGGGRELYSFEGGREPQWTVRVPMSTDRFSPGLAWYRDRLWVLGGNGTEDQLSTTEIFDPKTGRWSAGPALPHKMGWFAAFVTHGKLMIAGGLYFDKATQKYVFLDGAYVLED